MGEGPVKGKIKLKHTIVSLSLNVVTRNAVWAISHGDKRAQKPNTLSPGA